MKKLTVKDISFAAILAAMTVVLNIASINLGTEKITLYPLPLLLCGFLFGKNKLYIAPLTGAVAGLLMDLFGPYGITITTPLWMLAPIVWATLSGVLVKMFKLEEFKLWKIIVIIAITALSATLVNTIAMVVDYVLEKAFSVIIVSIITRFAVSIPFTIIYTAIIYFTYPTLNKLVNK